MNISNLKRVSDREVEKWLTDSLDLTAYQQGRIRDYELVRFSPFYFYQHIKKAKPSLLWRLTLPIYGVYWILLICALPLVFIFTGTWGYGRSFHDKFHSPWHQKLGL